MATVAELEDELLALIDAQEFPRRPQQRRSREKYEKILLAAAQLFAREGADEATTKDIAAAAQVSVGTLYSYFKDKRQILLSLVASNASLLLGPAGVELDFVDEPRGVFERALEQAVPYDPEACYLRQCWAELTADNAEIAAIGRKIHESLYERLVAAAEGARDRRGFRRDIDIEATAWAVLSLLDTLWHLPNKPGRAGREEFTKRRAAVAAIAYHAFFEGDPNGG